MLQAKVARHFERIDSTNAALLRDLSGPAPPQPGAVYTAAYQTAGRGQQNASWHGSPGDNLALSLYVRPERVTTDRLFALTAFTALSVRATIASCVPAPHHVRIKWPNDVYVGDRKIAGILVQNGLRGHRVQYSVVGIGLNVNEARFPPELMNSATSLLQLTGERHDLAAIRDRLLDACSARFGLLDPARMHDLMSDYRRHLYRYRQVAGYRRAGEDQTFRATLAEVTNEGVLHLRHPDGRVEAFASKQVSFVP